MKISLPLIQTLQASSWTSRDALKRDLQQPLQPSDRGSILSGHPATIIGGPANLLHTVAFTVGTPPQYFNAILDLASQDLLIPSSPPRHPNGLPRHFYNSTLSATYLANGTSSTSDFFGINTTGFLSSDHVRFGNLLFQSEMFQETDNMGINGCMFCDLEFDTAFPLGPYNASAERNYMSPIAHLVENALLDENKFSMRLSRNPGDGNGELVLGGLLDESFYTGDFVTIQMTDLPLPQAEDINPAYLSGDKWKFNVTSVQIGPSVEDRFTFPSPTIAMLDVSFSWMMLPYSLATTLNNFLEADTWGPFGWVDCAHRETWPNITLVLAGEKFELTPWDYTLEQETSDEPNALYCMSAFVGLLGDDDGLVLLGSSFLKAWVSVWDLDSGNVSFARATHGPPRDCTSRKEQSSNECRVIDDGD